MTSRLARVRRGVASSARRAGGQLRADLRADPYLLYLLAFATVVMCFWIWHRTPNFATRDERWRVLDPIRPLGFFLEDFDLGSIREGVTFWRSYGGTFYIYGLVALPVILFLLVTGQSDLLVDMAHQSTGGNLWEQWQSVPAWVWTATIVPARLVNAFLAVGSVYIVYRIGTLARDRATGRLAGLLLTLCWGVIVLAHEAGEDVPAMFCLLLAVYLALQYAQSGSRRTFYLGCLFGGIAAGFKLTGGVAAVALGVAHLSHARRSGDSFREALLDTRLLATGVAIGSVAILFSYPQMLAAAPEYVGGRVKRGIETKGSPHGWRVEASWWWILRGYLHGLGVPLALASVGGVAAALAWVRERTRVGLLARLSLIVLGTVLLVFSQWSYVRTHHLLLTFPFLVLLVAVAARRLADRHNTVARVLVAALVVSTGAYAITGDLGYAAQGRDQAADWVSANAAPNATVETYVIDPQEVGVPHDATVNKSIRHRKMVAVESRCSEYLVLGYHRSLAFLAPESYDSRTLSRSDREVRTHIQTLLDGGHSYEVAGRFGRQPRFMDDKPPRSTWSELLWTGVQPRTMQYGDPQDFGAHQYTIVLERTAKCGNETG